MTMFKEMVMDIITTAKAEDEINSSIELVNEEQNALDKALARLESQDVDPLARANRDSELDSYNDKMLDVMAGYDSRYMNRNDWKVAYKFRYSRKPRQINSLADDARFDYLCQMAGVKSTKKAKASIKEYKSLPKASYLPQKPIASTTDYTPKYTSYQTVKVVGYKMYKKAIVLDVLQQNEIRPSFRYDELVENGYDRNSYHDIDSRNTDESKMMVQHIVFRYVPFDRFGKPNPYDGIKQLRDFLHSQKFIASQNFIKVKDALDLLVGYTVDIPNVIPYGYTQRNDFLTVYSVFGDFENFENEFINE